MSLQNQLITAFNRIIDISGKPIRVRYFTRTYDSVYDEVSGLSISGSDVWTSGVVLPLGKIPSTDSILVEQGLITPSDQKLFIHGSLVLANSGLDIKIGLGSPNTDQYTIIPAGGVANEVANTKVFKQVYIRRLTTGSLYGE